MEPAFCLSPRQQLLRDLACQMPEADIASVETYFYFLRVAGEVSANQQTSLGCYELSEGKLVVLLLLHHAPHWRLTPSALAEAAGVTRGTISGLLGGLERSGLVRRTPHPGDKRCFNIELTRPALRLIEEVLPQGLHRITQLMAALDEGEQRQLRAFLEKMERGLSPAA